MTSLSKSPSPIPPNGDPFRSLWRPLLAGSFVMAMVFVFLKLGSEVVEGETQGFDQHILRFAQALREQYPILSDMMRDITGLGSVSVLTLFTVITVVYLALFSSRRMAALVAVAMISGTLLVSVFKAFFGRTRPDLTFAELAASGLSFPSGHASMSAIAYLTVGALIAATHKRTGERFYILLIAGFITLLVGLSRIALGVHWATDVIGGWAFGSAWAVLWLQLAKTFVKR
ncbi:phosphatase PAP2 family protein [Hydrogenophaga sp. PAMC20947]|uniref:phosphatase PAP2 family protein n=1 Tax=Hydrogenophaga sp. PAMC20947 TaxID=2565558 RepID=UPI0014484710|nr:phosphatase PAP2 family protein [Hydrogenophaga sp. PAMC20947]